MAEDRPIEDIAVQSDEMARRGLGTDLVVGVAQRVDATADERHP
jgi:hypothetical protein